MNKYKELYNYLIKSESDQIILEFERIEEIIGDKLPESAYKHKPWWSNSTKNGQHPYANSWLDAGYKTQDVSKMQPNKKVKFIKIK